MLSVQRYKQANIKDVAIKTTSCIYHFMYERINNVFMQHKVFFSIYTKVEF